MTTSESPRATNRHLVIDCDPGCDDALALLMAFDSGVYSAIDILTVAGNVGVNQTTENACKVAYLGALSNHECEVRVYKGCAVSLDGLRPSAASVHGRDGLGDVPDSVFVRDFAGYIRFRQRVMSSERAVEYYLRLARSGAASKRDLVCTGPLTNLASFLIGLGEEEHVAFWAHFDRAVIMAGALQVQGNVSFHGEFNAYADPLALKIVLDSIRTAQRSKGDDQPISPAVVLVTLDVTERLKLPWADLAPVFAERREAAARMRHARSVKVRGAYWEVKCGPVFDFACCMLQKYALFHGMHSGDASPKQHENYLTSRSVASSGLKAIQRFCYLHDPLALFAAIEFDSVLFEDVEVFVTTELGTTRGRIQQVERRRHFLEAPEGVSTADGTTTVKVIGADEFIAKCEQVFLERLNLAIGLKKA